MLLSDLNPRRSLAAAIIWLMVALAASFAVAASLWAGSVAREIVVQQHVRRVVLETDQLASDVDQAIRARIQALRTTDGSLSEVFAQLTTRYPELEWVAIADTSGNLVASGDGPVSRISAAGHAWFTGGLAGVWLGNAEDSQGQQSTRYIGDLSVALNDSTAHVRGVALAHVSWPWISSTVPRLSRALDPHGSAQTLILDGKSQVIIGPNSLLHAAWPGKPLGRSADLASFPDVSGAPQFERLPDGQTVLTVRALISRSDTVAPWQVQLSEPKEVVYQRADALALRIVWISVCLGALTALVGAFVATHLTNRLKALTRTTSAVGRNEIARIEVPAGRDEVAQVGAAFAKVLGDLTRERGELIALSAELERRVAVRTRQVERLADESRYAAIVRERLQIARDLHDTLAHSMMAMLSEIRLLRKLQAHEPSALADELAHAEEVAHAGLNEARSAITQLRGNSVRDTGLGPALAKIMERFKDHTGIDVEFTTDGEAARFGDERAQVLFRMGEEILRNIERHAKASRVRVGLNSLNGTQLELVIEDDGVGFDPKRSQPGHFGLVGLREQAQLIDADLEINSEADSGTSIHVRLRLLPEPL
jgi:signal transduction histidine kinase